MNPIFVSTQLSNYLPTGRFPFPRRAIISGGYHSLPIQREMGTVDITSMPTQDGNGVANTADNCAEIANTDQYEVDKDGTGNRCDCDFDQDDFCGGPDFSLFIGCFNASASASPTCAAADMDGDGIVGGPDFTLFIAGFNGAPGPSGQ